MLLSPFERLMAFRYLRARREEGLISVIAGFSLIGIALGVATLIVVLAVMRGVREEMIESIIGLEGHVTISASGGIRNYEALIHGVQEEQGVKSAIPIVQGQVMVSFRGLAAGAMVSGLRSEDMPFKPLVSQKLIAGGLEQGGVIVGKRMAERMGLTIGDMLTLISPEGRATPAGMVPRIKAYPVTGIFNIGMFAYDNGLVVMPFEDAQTFFKLSESGEAGEIPAPGRASAVEIIGTEADAAHALAVRLSKTLGSEYRVDDWKSSNNHLFRALMVQRNVFFMILMLIILVATFNIISSLVMLVREKGQDIAILRTMGATKQNILRIFMLCGSVVGVLGTAVGVALGLLIAANTESIQRWMESLAGQKLLTDELYFLSSLPAKVDAMEVLSVAALSLGLAFLATIYPARRAAMLDPAEALRYE